MKKIMIGALLIAGFLMAAGGGPDADGWIWMDSDEPDGPTFDWIEISSTGTPVWTSRHDDAHSGAISLPSTFTYRGQDFNSIYIGSNGWIGFDPSSLTNWYDSDPIDGQNPDNALHLLGRDLNPFFGTYGNDGYIYYQTMGDTMVVEFYHVPLYYNRGAYTFEAIIDCANDVVIYQYLSHSGSYTWQSYNFAVGCDNVDGSVALQVPYTLLKDNYAIYFGLPGGLSGSYDVAIVESVEPDNEYVEAGHEYNVSCRVYNNTGTLPEGSYRVMATIEDLDDGSEVFSEVSGFDGPLDEGESKVVVFGPWTPEEGKSYEITYSIFDEDVPDDEFTPNNTYIFTCTTKLPYDLAIEVVEPASDTYSPGDEVPLQAVVKNPGQQAPKDSVEVKAYVDDNEVKSQMIVAPESGDSLMIDFGTWTAEEGSHTIKYEVIWDEDMKQDNNTDTKDITVQGIASVISKKLMVKTDNGVEFILKNAGKGRIRIYDITGKAVKELTVTGDGTYRWDGNVGMYFARIETENMNKVVKFVLIR